MIKLHLNLKRKWFDMILSGKKKEEYRDISRYWNRRLMGLCTNDIKDTIIVFSNGYAKNRPQFEIELLNIEIGIGILEWGAEPHKKYFILKLGKTKDVNL